MSKYKHTVGIDVSKNTLDICLARGSKKIASLCISNDEKGLKALDKLLKQQQIPPKEVLFCCEHTGIYTNNLMNWAAHHSHDLWVESSITIKRSTGLNRGKNDQLDAYKIAMYGFRFKDKCQLWEVPREQVQELQQLNALRRRLILAKNSLKVPLKEAKSILGKPIMKRLEACSSNTHKALEADIKEVDKRICEVLASDPRLARLHKVITSVPGAGTQTAVILIIATNEFKRFQGTKKLACFAGVAPFEHSSGIAVKGRTRVSHLANKSLKAALHMCAIACISAKDPDIMAYYERKVAEGKNKMLVINAIRNKILARIWACIRDDREYEKKVIKKLG